MMGTRRGQAEGDKRSPRAWLAVFLAPTLALAWAIQPAAAAVAIQICLAIDASGSIAAGEFSLETGGFASAVEDPALVPQNSSVEVTVIVFATSATTVVPPTLIDSPSTAGTVGTAIRNADRSGVGILTDIAEAIELCTAEITGSSQLAGSASRAINIATNGQPAGGGDPLIARNNAVAAGVDRLDAEAVAPGANVAILLDLVWPQPGEKVTPPDSPGGDTGFVLNVSSFEEFGPAIETKIAAILPPPPQALGGAAAFPEVSQPAQSATGSGGGGATLAAAAIVGSLAAGLGLGSAALFATRRRLRGTRIWVPGRTERRWKVPE